MSNNAIFRKLDLTPSYQPLSADDTVGSVVISAPPSNAGTAFFKGDTGDDVNLCPGEWHQFFRVQLRSIYIKGMVGDIVTIIGGSW